MDPDLRSSLREKDTTRTRTSLLRALQERGQHYRWIEFYNIYARLIRTVARNKGVAESDVEDVVQETMVAVAGSVGRFDYDPRRCRFKTWLMRITLSKIADWMRSRSRRPREVVLEEGEVAEEFLGEESVGDLERIWNQEWCAALGELALERLKKVTSQEMFQIFFLHCYRGQSADCVAGTLEVSRAYVYLVKFRCMPKYEQLVKQILAEWES